MNPNHSASFKFPAIKPQSWSKVFKNKAGDKAIDLISKWLRYKPLERLSPLESLAHPFFDELREPGLKLPNGRPLPPLFNFTEKELRLIGCILSESLASSTLFCSAFSAAPCCSCATHRS